MAKLVAWIFIILLVLGLIGVFIEKCPTLAVIVILAIVILVCFKLFGG